MTSAQESADVALQPANDPSDAELLCAAAAGDQGAWDLLVDRYVPDVWTAACTSGATTAAAAAASAIAWLRLSQRLGEHEVTEGLSVGSWLARTALGAARSAARAESSTASSLDPRRTQEPASVRVLEASAAARQRAHELRSRLASAQRQSERAVHRAVLLLTALSLDESSPDLHAIRDVGPLTGQRGVTLCHLLAGHDVRLLKGIEWRDVRAADRCPTCARAEAG